MWKMMKSRMLAAGPALIALISLATAGPALALEPIAVPDGVEQAPSEGCSQLTRLKYPFLGCSTDENGNLTLNAVGIGLAAAVENVDGFVTGDGYWGASLLD
jgi:hypothetical protein